MGAEGLNYSLETMQQINEEFGDEADEETLSLCDLVMSSDVNEYWNDDFSKEDHHHDQDFFEFFSEDFPAAAASSTYPEDNNIIFCGKLIPLKEDVKQENEKKKKNISSCIFPWKKSSHSIFNKSRTFPSSSSSSAKESRGKSFNKSLSLPAWGSKNNHGKFGSEIKKLGDDEKFDFSVKKVSILATPVKSRWYLFAFGVGRFPMEIELKNMKMRQSRRKSKAMKFQVPDCGEPENVKGDKERRRSTKGLWRLLKVLGWNIKYTNASVIF
ncbi:uncharacterized protein LOC111309531 [Durio zibethinus]|uniref:Uncharacterized protein LOC111309531 n=1 Tax=Durio zibethinus TaxID=66656 RepID=A0A6P6AHF0_DURZI|nr:uncharacterized protein LOC111309531 [Durio zibethinus]